MSGCSRCGGEGTGGAGAVSSLAPTRSSRWMAWCSAKDLAHDLVSLVEHLHRDHAETAVTVVDQPVTGASVQLRLAVGEQDFESLRHRHREHAVRQADVGAVFAGHGGRRGAILVAETHLRDAPVLAI